jgi:hypothetical protein
MRDLTKQEVITLIQKMNELNNREYAKFVYLREIENHPEWELEQAFLEIKAAKKAKS